VLLLPSSSYNRSRLTLPRKGGSFEQSIMRTGLQFEMVIIPLKVQHPPGSPVAHGGNPLFCASGSQKHTESSNSKAVMVSKFNIKPSFMTGFLPNFLMKSQESRVKRSQSSAGFPPLKNHPFIEVPDLQGSGVELAFNSQKILDSGLREAD
jgi:hypothetical protein